MIQNGQCRFRFLRSRRSFFLLVAALAWMLPSLATAVVVTVDLGWGYNVPGGADLLDYNLQVGSVVQIIMYQSDQALPPGSAASDNFDAMGNYTGDDISSEPYPDDQTTHVPGDTTVYDPLTAPDGHVIVYTATIQAAPYLDDNNNVWWQVYASFEVVGTFDRLYVRVFGTDDISDRGVFASYWGLSDVQVGTNDVFSWFVGPLDEITANRSNYFMVIPEPGTLTLLALGGAALAGARLKRRSRTPSNTGKMVRGS